MTKNAITRQFVANMAAAVLIVGSHAAAIRAAEAPADGWEFRATVSGYFPAISASTQFPTGHDTDAEIDADKLLRHLKLGFSGSFEARKDSWGLYTDLLYLDVGGSRSGRRDLSIAGQSLPAGITAKADLDIEGMAGTLAATYRILSLPELTIDAFAGARLIYLKGELEWELSGDVGPFSGPSRKGSSTSSHDGWDAIGGVKGRFHFGPNHEWFIPYYLDLGTGESQLTWQGVGGIGYAFPWCEISTSWRYLSYELKSGARIDNLHFNGPSISLGIPW